MKYLKIFEDYFDKESLWSEPEGDEILKGFDEGTIESATKEVEVKPTFRHDGDTTETTFRFNVNGKSVFVQHLEYPHRDPIIIIKINGSFSDIAKDSPYREEILKRCQETIQ
jgi:hypothetical protein